MVETDPTSPKRIPLTPTLAEIKANSQLKEWVVPYSWRSSTLASDRGLSVRILGITNPWISRSHLHRFPSKDKEVLCSHHHEAHELVAQNLLNLIGLVRAEEKRCFPEADTEANRNPSPALLTPFPQAHWRQCVWYWEQLLPQL